MAPVIANDFKNPSYFCHRDRRKQCLEARVAVRGKDRFVVMGIAQYHYLSECEQDAALAQTRDDVWRQAAWCGSRRRLTWTV